MFCCGASVAELSERRCSWLAPSVILSEPSLFISRDRIAGTDGCSDRCVHVIEASVLSRHDRFERRCARGHGRKIHQAYGEERNQTGSYDRQDGRTHSFLSRTATRIDALCLALSIISATFSLHRSCERSTPLLRSE